MLMIIMLTLSFVEANLINNLNDLFRLNIISRSCRSHSCEYHAVIDPGVHNGFETSLGKKKNRTASLKFAVNQFQHLSWARTPFGQGVLRGPREGRTRRRQRVARAAVPAVPLVGPGVARHGRVHQHGPGVHEQADASPGRWADQAERKAVSTDAAKVGLDVLALHDLSGFFRFDLHRFSGRAFNLLLWLRRGGWHQVQARRAAVPPELSRFGLLHFLFTGAAAPVAGVQAQEGGDSCRGQEQVPVRVVLQGLHVVHYRLLEVLSSCVWWF